MYKSQDKIHIEHVNLILPGLSVNRRAGTSVGRGDQGELVVERLAASVTTLYCPGTCTTHVMGD